MTHISLAIVDDHQLIRASLSELFKTSAPDIRVVAEAGDGRSALNLVRYKLFDVLLLDLGMPGQGGMDVIQTLKRHAPNVRVLVFSSYPEEQYALKLLKLGASGYLNKQCDLAEILLAVRTVAAGRHYFSPRVAAILAEDRLADHSKSVGPHRLLSDREFQVFIKLAAGLSTREVGSALALSARTISAHRTAILKKLELNGNSDLTRYALEHRLLE